MEDPPLGGGVQSRSSRSTSVCRKPPDSWEEEGADFLDLGPNQNQNGSEGAWTDANANLVIAPVINQFETAEI